MFICGCAKIIKYVGRRETRSFVMEKWRHQEPYLRAIAEGTTKQRRHVLDHASNQLLHCLCECALNVSEGTVKLTPSQKKVLVKHRRKLLILACSDVPLKYKRQVLRQRGSGNFFQNVILPVLKQLPALLPAVIPLLL